MQRIQKSKLHGPQKRLQRFLALLGVKNLENSYIDIETGSWAAWEFLGINDRMVRVANRVRSGKPWVDLSGWDCTEKILSHR